MMLRFMMTRTLAQTHPSQKYFLRRISSQIGEAPFLGAERQDGLSWSRNDGGPLKFYCSGHLTK